MLFFFFASFVNPKQWRPLVVHKLTSRTSVGVEDWSNSSRAFPLGPLCVCWCCCCCCLPSRRLLNNTRSICSWHSLRTSWTPGTSKRKKMLMIIYLQFSFLKAIRFIAFIATIKRRSYFPSHSFFSLNWKSLCNKKYGRSLISIYIEVRHQKGNLQNKLGAFWRPHFEQLPDQEQSPNITSACSSCPLNTSLGPVHVHITNPPPPI